MQMVDHPNVLKLYEIRDEPRRMNLILELATGGELFDRISFRGRYTEADAASTTRTICDALAYLHARSIVHRDLKPENLLYLSPADDAPIKIADFGLARLVSIEEIMNEVSGTSSYLAPETLTKGGQTSSAVDMWSVGV